MLRGTFDAWVLSIIWLVAVVEATWHPWLWFIVGLLDIVLIRLWL